MTVRCDDEISTGRTSAVDLTHKGGNETHEDNDMQELGGPCDSRSMEKPLMRSSRRRTSI